MATSSPNYQIISADGHTIEPPHMWETYLPAKFHDRMPRLVKDPKGGDAWELVPGRAADAARSRDQRGAMGQTVRRARVVRLDVRQRPRRRVRRQGAPRGPGHRRRLRRGPLSVAADDEHVHGPARRRLPPRRHRCVQPVDARRVHGRRSAAPDRSVPDAVGRHRRVGGEAAGSEEPRLPRRDHLGVPERQPEALRRRRPVLGGGRGRGRCRCTSTSV